MGFGRKAIDKQTLIKNGEKPVRYSESKEIPDNRQLIDVPIKAVSFLKLFRFADKLDCLLLIIATVCALTHGAAWPFMMIILGDTVQAYVDQAKFDHYLDKIPDVLKQLGLHKRYIYKHVEEFLPYCPNVSALTNASLDCNSFDLSETVFDQMSDQAAEYAYIGAVSFVAALGQLYFFIWTSERQILRMRFHFYQNVLKQEMAWFDAQTPGGLAVKITDDIAKIHDAIGDKTGTSIQWFASSVTGGVICFTYGWKLSLVMLSSGPALCVAFGVVATLFANMAAKERVAYANAGAVAEEVFSAIRTVAAFGGQEKEAERYSKCLEKAKRCGIQKSKVSGLGQGLAWGIIFGCFGVGFYYGGKLVRDGDYTEKEMIIVFLTSLIACMSLGMASPALSTIKDGCGAAFGVFEILDKILDGLDLTIKPGQTVALVGSSGCGKSTTMQLLLRFYDVLSGKVTVDGLDVRKLNLKWLRQRIGLVGQEPVLFPTTIAENIRYGKDGVSMEEIIQATKDANAYNFIMKLPQAFDTNVGERGAQLSGGQKQRIAIARALVSDPKILLLDEATSALDTESEAIVQDALDKASQGRSTIVIAHRLSTVRNADIIVTLHQGKVIEKGTHEELMAKKGAYYHLVFAQQKKRTVSTAEEDDGQESNEGADKVVPMGVEFERLDRAKSIEEENEESMQGNKYVNKGTFVRLVKMNKGEWHHLVFGALGAMVNGAAQPAWGLTLAFVLEAFTKDSKEDQKDLMNKMALITFGIAAISVVAYFMQEYSFGVSGESLTKKMRDLAFRSMVRQEIGWFDDDKNQTGALSSQLAVEASLVQGAVKTVLAATILSLGNLGTGTIIGFFFSWRLSLLSLAFAPFVIATGLLNAKYLGGAANDQKAAMEEASKSSMASIDNVRTVASLTREEKFYEEFTKSLSEPLKANNRSTFISSVAFAISQSAYFFTFSGCFYYGAKLLEEDKIASADVFKVFNCIILGSVQLGQALSFSPNTSKALQSAGRIFSLAEVTPKIDPYSSSGYKPKEGTFTSRIRFSETNFRYPTRPDIQVLRNFDITVEPGQMMALVGESGCGKSTLIQLLQRFYDAESGSVHLDKYDIRDLNLQWLRSQIGMVSQEPILFDASIAENIAYGDNSRTVNMEEVIAAARSANIHNFIQALPDGYKTNVGSKGAQLSGGQKQRVAIARALIRNPKVLLLDEATSALDTESEKIVQDALDRARQGRTCITIAHRLSTIKNADVIAVLKAGKVSELGTHSQLMARKGLYYQLQEVQNS